MNMRIAVLAMGLMTAADLACAQTISSEELHRIVASNASDAVNAFNSENSTTTATNANTNQNQNANSADQHRRADANAGGDKQPPPNGNQQQRNGGN